MSIIEIKNQLISHFYDNDSFTVSPDSPDIQKIQLDDNLSHVKDDIIASVLSELETMGMIKKVSAQVWLLTQSFDTFNQSVILSANSSEIIADTINSFRDANEISGDVCDKTKIVEADIMNLVNICHALLEESHHEDSDLDME
jgi:hypothetical protein